MNDTPPESLFQSDWEAPDDSFYALPLERKILSMPVTQAYAVHLPNGDRKFVRAESALAALRESGVSKPLRIERLGTEHFNIYYPVGLTTRNSSEHQSE